MKSLHKVRYLLLASVLWLASSCESDFLDVNQDPNEATSAEPPLLFTGALNDYSTNRVIDFGPTAATAAQLWSGGGNLGAGVFTQPERYVISIFSNGNTWRAHYRSIQKNLALAIQGAESAEPVNNNAAAQCKIFRALTFLSTTLIWEDAPFTEAVDIDFETLELQSSDPNFDAQEDVLNGVLGLLDEAIAQIDPESPLAITGNDLIFGGDMDNWRKFAKSLKLRTLMIMVDADPSKAADIATLVEEGDMIASADDDAEFPFFGESGNRNPFWETLNAFSGGQNLFYFASEAMVELMKEYNDPRLETYFDPLPTDDGPSPDSEVMGVPPGGNIPTSMAWVLSTAPLGQDGTFELVRPTTPDVLFSYQEQLFLEAEAIARGLAPGGLAEADDRFRAAVRAAMAARGVTEEATNTFLESIAPLTEANAVEIIAEQTWIDQIIRPLEGWTTWRRTDAPDLEVPEGAQTTGLFRRFPLPPDEVSANDNAPVEKPLDERMWFEQ